MLMLADKDLCEAQRTINYSTPLELYLFQDPFAKCWPLNSIKNEAESIHKAE